MAQILFETVAREWWERFKLRGAAHYAEESWRRLAREVIPELGHRPLSKIDAPMILAILRRVESRGTLKPRTSSRRISRKSCAMASPAAWCTATRHAI